MGPKLFGPPPEALKNAATAILTQFGRQSPYKHRKQTLKNCICFNVAVYFTNQPTPVAREMKARICV